MVDTTIGVVICSITHAVIDHDGLFIYVDPGYAGSFHDVNCLRNSDLHRIGVIALRVYQVKATLLLTSSIY